MFSSSSRKSPFRFLLEHPLSIGFRILFLALLCSGIAVGALNQSYGISSLAASIGIDPDAVLVVIGIVNKVLDYVLGDTITHIASVSLTVWLATTTRFAGVGWHDFDLEIEMSKPYISVYRFWQKWRSPDHHIGWWDVGRLLLTFASAMAVLLLGAMINVLVIPKSILLPGTTNGVINITTVGAFFEVPTQHIAAIDWTTFNESQIQIPQGKILEDLRLSSSLVQAVAGIVPAISSCADSRSYCQEKSYFRVVSNEIVANTSRDECQRRANPAFCTAPYVRYTWLQPLDDQARTTSSSTQIATNFYMRTIANEAIVQQSTCVRNWFYATLPIIESQCHMNSAAITNESFSLTFENAPTGGLIRTRIGSMGNDNQSFECNSTLAQYLYPMYQSGCSDDGSKVWENWPNTQYYNATLLNTTALNANILETVSQKFSSLTSLIDPVSGGSFGSLVTNAGAASVSQDQSSPGPRTREVGTAFAVGTIISHLIALADWTLEDSGEIHSSGPLQFLVYGSGPRQNWQWVLIIIAGICIIVMLYDIYLIAFKPGPAWWLDTPGLLVFANDSNRMGYPVDEKRLEKDRSTRLYARNQDGRATLTLDPTSGKTFQKPEKEIGATMASGHEMEVLERRRMPVADNIALSRQSTQPLLSHESEVQGTEQSTREHPASSST